MTITREHLHELIAGLPEQEIATAQRFLLFLTQETVGLEFERSIKRGLDQVNSGQTVVCRNYGEMVEKLLGD